MLFIHWITEHEFGNERFKISRIINIKQFHVIFYSNLSSYLLWLEIQAFS